MPKIFTSPTQKTGEFAEEKVSEFLMKHGFEILDRNYTRKWGEIDIIALKDNRIYFTEVKSKTITDIKWIDNGYRAEDQMHPWKLKRLSRIIQTYLLSNPKYENLEWQLDLAIVYLKPEGEVIEIKLEKDIIL